MGKPHNHMQTSQLMVHSAKTSCAPLPEISGDQSLMLCCGGTTAREATQVGHACVLQGRLCLICEP